VVKKIKIGLVGVGSVAHWGHIPAYQNDPRAEITAICDINEERLKTTAEELNVKEVYTDFNEMMAKSDCDAISVATWNNSHKDATIAGLKAGKAVLCEKPMAMNAQEAEEMLKVSRETGSLLMIGFCSRFGDDAMRLKSFIEDGSLGDIYYVKAGYLRRRGNPKGWFADKARSGGGALIDIGVHALDRSWWLMGKPKPVSVMGFAWNNFGDYKTKGEVYSSDLLDEKSAFDTDDMAVALIRFEGDKALFLEASWAQNIKEGLGYQEVYGNKGGAKLYPLELYTDIDYNQVNIQVPTSQVILHNAEIKHFLDCVEKGEETIAPGEDGVTIMKILDAIYESSRTKKEVFIK